MKKLISALLASALLLSLAACSNKGDSLPGATMKYYDYLSKHMYVMMLFDHLPDTTGFSDEEMAAYAISAAARAEDNFDFAVGIDKEKFDDVTKKYFGKTITEYENDKTTVLENGNITATGWDFTPHLFILKELSEVSGGPSKKAVFYRVLSPMDDDVEKVKKLKSSFLKGDFSEAGDVELVEMEFEEMTDESGDLYLKFISINEKGKAAAPFTVHP